jgi:hypothetical protein
LEYLHKRRLGKGLQRTNSELYSTRLHQFRSSQFDLIAIQVLFTQYAKNGKKTLAERCSLTTEPIPFPKSPTLAKSNTENWISNNFKPSAPHHIYISLFAHNKSLVAYTVDGVSSFFSILAGVDGSRCIRIDDLRDWGGGLQ